MHNEMRLRKVLDRPSIQDKVESLKRERYFELSLPTMVNGINAVGKEFSEETRLTSISSQIVKFSLKSKLTIGSRLNLSLDIPKTIILEYPMNLFISGEVIFIKADSNGQSKQFVSVKLDKNFKIQKYQLLSSSIA